MKKILSLSLLLCLPVAYSMACTNLIVGKKASADGSVLCTYSADSYGMFNYLYHSPAATHAKGEMVDIYDWDTNAYHGQIPQVEQTYNVIGNINEWQVTIGETTYGGREEMMDTTGIIDYGSLIRLGLQRAKTAREAIAVMTSLVETYGYNSEGETFTICDPDEAWIMEMQGAGPKGVVWVAVRIPDDAICAHANQSRITTFNQKDRHNVLFSKNCIKYARQQGWFSGKDADFSWNAAYAAPDFSGRRICDARVWSFFNRFVDGMDKYLPWAEGVEKDATPLPLWVVPSKKVGVSDLQTAMRDHYEGTPLSSEGTIAGGIWEMPYYPTPLYFTVDGKKYFTERPISTQQACFTYVAQMRSWLPRQIGGILWFGNDDANMVAYVPVYCCNTEVPYCFTNGMGADDVTFSDKNAFWMCNFVSNMVYPRYNMLFPELKAVRDSLDNSFFAAQQETENHAKSLYDNGNSQSSLETAKFLTAYSNRKAAEMMTSWHKLARTIIVKYNDMVIKQVKDGKYVKDENGLIAPVIRPGYPEKYARKMVELSGGKMAQPE